MTLTPVFFRLFKFLLAHYLDCEGQRIGLLNEVQSGVIYGFNYLGRSTNDEKERADLWTEADSQEQWLESVLSDWQYRRFYLRRFLDRLRQLNRGENAVAA